MISVQELNEVKEKRRTNLYYSEKEYFQYIFLNAISSYQDNFIFKGGTCLRICYGLQRASEDLDFASNLPIEKIKEIVKKCLNDYNLLNISSEFYAVKEYKGNLRMEIRFKGPLFNGNLSSTNTLKIDFNKQRVRNKVVKVVDKLFSDIPLFTIYTIDEKEILTEKIRALINRGEGRDLYDVWILLGKGIKIDEKLLDIKLKDENSKLSRLRLPIKEKYELELKNLIINLPPYEQVKEEVMKEINKIKRLK